MKKIVFLSFLFCSLVLNAQLINLDSLEAYKLRARANGISLNDYLTQLLVSKETNSLSISGGTFNVATSTLITVANPSFSILNPTFTVGNPTMEISGEVNLGSAAMSTLSSIRTNVMAIHTLFNGGTAKLSSVSAATITSMPVVTVAPVSFSSRQQVEPQLPFSAISFSCLGCSAPLDLADLVTRLNEFKAGNSSSLLYDMKVFPGGDGYFILLTYKEE